MKQRLALGALLGAALLAFALLRERIPAVERPAAGATSPRAPRATGRVTTVAPAPVRNVFEYAAPSARPPLTAKRGPAATPAPVELPLEAPIVALAEPVRLVGLVHRGGTRRAALSISGEVVILAPGEAAEGYRVLSIDDEAGVRLRGPDGAERALALPDKR